MWEASCPAEVSFGGKVVSYDVRSRSLPMMSVRKVYLLLPTRGLDRVATLVPDGNAMRSSLLRVGPIRYTGSVVLSIDVLLLFARIFGPSGRIYAEFPSCAPRS